MSMGPEFTRFRMAAAKQIEHLQAENAALNETTKKHVAAYYELLAENAELREYCQRLERDSELFRADIVPRLQEDKARLDWLEANLYTLWASGLRCNESPAVEIAARTGKFEAESLRAAIDAARKEAQP